MRLAFVEELTKLTQADPNIFFITGDLGFAVFEPYMTQFPHAFLNAGVAEQNMIGVATGLALSGKTVFVYSIANFPTLRCLEQIRNDICYHRANVKIVSVGCGYSYGLQGYTHFGIEDISILRSLPNMRIFSPADPYETRLAVREMVNYEGPCYLRLGNSREKNLHTQELTTEPLPGMLPVKKSSSKTLVLATGVITTYTYEKICEANLDCNVWSVPCVHPLDKQHLLQIITNIEKIFTVEEHQLAGGFGSAVLEVLHDLKNTGEIHTIPAIHRIGIDKPAMRDIGNQDYLRGQIDFSALFN